MRLGNSTVQQEGQSIYIYIIIKQKVQKSDDDDDDDDGKKKVNADLMYV